MRSWLPTQASTDLSLRVTLDRRRLAALLAPVAAVGDTATLRVTSDELVVRAADDARVRSVTTRLDADACHQYAVTPGQLTFDPTTLRAALTADATASAETEPITLAYGSGDETLSLSLPTLTHEQPVDPTRQSQTAQVTEWPDGATLCHRAETLTEVCAYFAAIAELITVEYDGPQNAFRIESATPQSDDDAPSATGAYEWNGTELPGETSVGTVQAAFDSTLLRDVVAMAPGNARVRLDIADVHPLRLRWTAPTSERSDDTPVETTALLAPRDPPDRDEGDAE